MRMKLPPHRTKLVATIGPASAHPPTLLAMVHSGMNIARLNFSHGTFDGHARVVAMVREAAREADRPVTIMADLPGPKMRIGAISGGHVQLVAGDPFTLTTRPVEGSAAMVSISMPELPEAVKPGNKLFLNDGIIQLVVEEVAGEDIRCCIEVGGPLSSKKGLNFPGVNLGIRAFTARDRECLAFAIEQGIEAVSQSFVQGAADIAAVRDAASACGGSPFVIAKIERREAIENFGEILAAADGVMVARGDLGVEVPVHEIALVQKRIIAAANEACKPVITATQMLESMTHSRLPTRAEVADVSNAILDGTDCVMLSAESASGQFPVESVRMLASIAESAEQFRSWRTAAEAPLSDDALRDFNPRAFLVSRALDLADFDAVLVPSYSGNAARMVARSRLPVWAFAVSGEAPVLGGLAFSFGVWPIRCDDEPEEWNEFARELATRLVPSPRRILLAIGRSAKRPDANPRLELFTV